MLTKQMKDDFIAEWNEMLPDGILDKAETAIPALENTSMPTDAETAIVAQGVLAHNLNTILKTFEGLTPIDLILHIGQRNAVNKAIMLASLEYKEKALAGFEILSPDPPEVRSYQTGWDILFSIQISQDIQDATEELTFSCSIDIYGENDPLDVPLTQDEENPEIFSGTVQISTASDSWFAEFTALFDGYEVSEIRNFRVTE